MGNPAFPCLIVHLPLMLTYMWLLENAMTVGHGIVGIAEVLVGLGAQIP